MKIVNLSSLLAEFKQLPADVVASGNDKRFLLEQLKSLGFVMVNASYYRLVLDHKGKRIVLGCKLYSDSYQLVQSRKTVFTGKLRDYVAHNKRVRDDLSFWAGIHMMPDNLTYFDAFTQ
jgi:hypothetical protein